jgi:hypothetical protein
LSEGAARNRPGGRHASRRAGSRERDNGQHTDEPPDLHCVRSICVNGVLVNYCCVVVLTVRFSAATDAATSASSFCAS